MKLNRNKATFGRHETFPLRYGWLTKGVEAIKKTPGIFSVPMDAMVQLGVGRNMVNAVRYWLQVTNIVKFDDGEGSVTSIGEALIGDEGDRYLEDEATLWIIHWLIASNAELATGFYWFFNHFSIPSFQDKDSLQALSSFVEQEMKTNRSQSTLKSDISTLFRMYAPVASRSDDHLDSPLAQLQLIDTEVEQSHRSPRTLRPFLPPIALHFALQQRFFAQPQQPAFPIRVLLYGGDGWAIPGAVFRLNEGGLMHAMERVVEYYPEYYELRETAGLHQIYRNTEVVEPSSVLRTYYQRAVA